MRAVIYVRVSDDVRGDGRSVTEQENECRAFCARKGWRVVDVLSDNDRSASRYARQVRPAYTRLCAMVEAGQVDALVLWEASRSTRDLADYVRLRDLCATAGTLYVYNGQVHDLATTDGRFATGLDVLLAEREASLTRDRILRAHRANELAGKPHGKLPFGFGREYGPSGAFSRQVPAEPQASIVREMARRVLAGESCYAVAGDLNARGVPNPARAAAARNGADLDRGGRHGWSLIQVRRILLSPTYAGLRVARGKVIGPADWPAIIDVDDHRRLVRLLGDPHRRTVIDPNVSHLLTGIAECAVCGGKLAALKDVRSQEGHRTLSCRQNHCVSIRERWLDEYVQATLIARLSMPDARDVFRPDDDAAGREAARVEAEALQERLDEFAASAAAGEISPGMLARVERELEPRIADAVRRAAPPPRVGVVDELLSAGDVAARWSVLPVSARRAVVDALMVVRLGRTYRGARRFDPGRVVRPVWRRDC